MSTLVAPALQGGRDTRPQVDGEFGEAAQDPGGPAQRRSGRLQVRESVEEQPQADLALQAGQRRAEAVVRAAAEREVVLGVRPGDVESVRVGEDGGGTVCPADD